MSYEEECNYTVIALLMEFLVLYNIVEFAKDLGRAMQNGWSFFDYLWMCISVEWEFTQVEYAVDALVETGINLEYYSSIIADVESFCEVLFC